MVKSRTLKDEHWWSLTWKSIACMVVAGVALFFALGVFACLIDGGGGWFVWGHTLAHDEWFSAMRNAVGFVAFLVAGGAAYLAYRKQRTADLSHTLATQRHAADSLSELRTRFSTAVDQLSHASGAVRIAGVHGLAIVVDEWLERGNKSEAQMCVDVLCSYLKLPSPRDSDDFQTKRVVKKGGTVAGAEAEEIHFEFPQNDRFVRVAVCEVIARRLMPSSDGLTRPWAQLSLDFTDAHVFDAAFPRCVFNDLMVFKRTRFEGRTMFSGSRFHVLAFEKCTFEGPVDFNESTITGTLLIDNGTFPSTTEIPTAPITSPEDQTLFRGEVDFSDVVIEGPTMISATAFRAPVSFKSATFKEGFSFSQVAGSGFDFSAAHFRKGGIVQATNSSGEVTFEGAFFARPILFIHANWRRSIHDTWSSWAKAIGVNAISDQVEETPEIKTTLRARVSDKCAVVWDGLLTGLNLRRKSDGVVPADDPSKDPDQDTRQGEGAGKDPDLNDEGAPAR